MAFSSKIGRLCRSHISRELIMGSRFSFSMFNAVRYMSATPSATLHVSELGYGIEDRDLQLAFADYGDVIYAKVERDPITLRSHGYGFVKFGKEESARIALQKMNGTKLYGRELVVEYAIQKGKPALKMKTAQPRRTFADYSFMSMTEPVERICHHCKEVGHIKSKCPHIMEASASACTEGRKSGRRNGKRSVRGGGRRGYSGYSMQKMRLSYSLQNCSNRYRP